MATAIVSSAVRISLVVVSVCGDGESGEWR